MTSRHFFFFAAVFASGCGGKVLEEEAAPAPVVDVPAERVGGGTPAPANRTFDPFHAGDSWRGTYTCPQGLTNLELRIVSMHDDAIDDAEFVFDWAAGGVTGSFHLSGTFDPTAGRATLAPGAWIDDPNAKGFSDWYTVGLAGSADANVFAGDVTSPGCGSFELTKQ